MNVLNVRIDNLSITEVLEKVTEFLNSNKSHKIFTPNPEILVDAQKDNYFKTVLNSGDLNVCDGTGLKLAMWLPHSFQEGVGLPDMPSRQAGGVAEADETPANSTGLRPPPLRKRRITRYPGIDLMHDICAFAEKTNKSVYLLGSGSEEVIRKTGDELRKKFKNLQIVGLNKGMKIKRLKDYKISYDKEENDEIVQQIIMSAPDILFVAFGHGKQEKWINENLKDLPSVRIAMGVGGAFDYISGTVKRAPLFLRQIGLEWLYRLIKQPQRIKRIWKATVVFIYYLCFHKKV
ncbi:MAG: N-acetylmannosaminyltransferase TagA [Candidatus Magasanikbacteria bacterium GW2011_GWC2_37_14]|uniref:N-acetylmannosaminyltransferase TagA n=1 Tax=Candidatus Magasanikbacteria bacterium GW2011_GWC2_37_14 TaxID=1619046 RepID=A0A0G0GDS0_9BACT|nr:MAG: N-acetylmannosaminyltransferase TagA [Candidatus Magasanikbacteria bacterium GW2011_GWC2_37_14]